MPKIHHIKKGLDIPLSGTAPLQLDSYSHSRFIISPGDFKWWSPSLLVNENDEVKVGTPLFEDKENSRVKIVSPVSGKINRIHRGAKRKIEMIEIESDSRYIPIALNIPENPDRESLIQTLLDTGLWPFITQRPFGITANPNDKPKSIFVSCFDTAPLAPDYNFIINRQQEEFLQGLSLLAKLTVGKIHLGLHENQRDTIITKDTKIETHYFTGKHPAGNVGTQIHHIDPINKGEVVWCINPQAVIMIGRLFLHKKLDFNKIVAVTGCKTTHNRYVELTNGISLDGLWKDSPLNENTRMISGNILTGRDITQSGAIGFYDSQVTLLQEGGERELIGWLLPGFKKWSISRTFTSWLFRKKSYSPDTSLHGGRRPFIMTGVYEKVFPFDILPLQLLKACIIKDIELMEALGIYEVIEEDFALCEVVCPSKNDCQQIIAEGLRLIRG
ncbi:Na(+)-translocating NADH-quinone reductase subunit A [Bacteroidales bacterium OttesenSCG-928-B11]|nr:Na(+)-translocating NADH-quinone reductase subunit A [Bacteroidales bacterium OttesenSCG-928-C03]MDL2312921.1 Na(+)-translocating NADH-quinone reductase subunit A [Bacteroidales bacterium OttesenSCG-928-B11]MDL2326598.1 Na(+)-translocating NADH-quinone reductase subunit A [Bacteroidales bacterium OttesenSCG-928-A14]